MALFDFAQIGKDLCKTKTKGSETPRVVYGAKDDPLDSDFQLEDVQNDDTSTIVSSDSQSSIESADSLTEKRSLWKRSKAKSARTLKNALSMSFIQTSRSKSPSRTSKETKEEPNQEVYISYQAIPVSQSNSFSLEAYNAGWGPAYAILKSMTCEEREIIMKSLLVKRKTEWYNEEVDSHAIIFKSVFGMRSRTSTAFRQIGIMKKGTWVHALIKCTNAFKISAKMVIASGDWRMPTRVTDKTTRKQALKASQAAQEECDADDNAETLAKIERNFYIQMQRSIEARLGSDLANAIADWVLEQAGQENAAAFEEYLEKRHQKDEKRDKKIARKKNRKNKSQFEIIDSACDSESGSDSDSLPEARGMQLSDKVDPQQLDKFLSDLCFISIPEMVQNMEKVRTGYGRFAILVAQTLVLKNIFVSQQKLQGEPPKNFMFTNQKDMIKKLAIVGAKDGIIGLSLGIPLATFVNPFLGLPLMAFSLINLSIGSTELNILETACMMMMHNLLLACNGTNISAMH